MTPSLPARAAAESCFMFLPHKRRKLNSKRQREQIPNSADTVGRRDCVPSALPKSSECRHSWKQNITYRLFPDPLPLGLKPSLDYKLDQAAIQDLHKYCKVMVSADQRV